MFLGFHVTRILAAVPEKSHQGAPQGCEEGFLYAGETQVFRAGGV